jgi:hypothetical protein
MGAEFLRTLGPQNMPPHCGQCRKQMARVMPQIMTLHRATSQSLSVHPSTSCGVMSAARSSAARLKQARSLRAQHKARCAAAVAAHRRVFIHTAAPRLPADGRSAHPSHLKES